MIRPTREIKNERVVICIHEHRRFIHSFIDRSVVSTSAEYFGVVIFIENDRIRYSLMGRYNSWEKRSHNRVYLA